MGLSKKIKELKYNDFFNGITFGKIFISGLLIASLQSEAKAENFIVSMQNVVAEFNDNLGKVASWDFDTKLNNKTNRYEYIKDERKIKTSFDKTIGTDALSEKEKKYFKNVILLSNELEKKEKMNNSLDLDLIKYIYRNLYSVNSNSPVYKEIEEKIIENYNNTIKFSNNSELKIVNNNSELNFNKISDIYKTMSNIAYFEQKAFDIQKNIKNNNFNNYSNYEKRKIPIFLNEIYKIYLDASKFKIDENKIYKLYSDLSKENSNTKLYKFMINEIKKVYSGLKTIEPLLTIENSNKRTLEGVFEEAYSKFSKKEKKKENNISRD